MIAQITGRLIAKKPDQIVVDTNGVGYRLLVSLATFYQLPGLHQEVSLLVTTVVREDAFLLYGFAQEDEREAFAALTGVSGVGPKVARGILSGISPEELWLAVRARDTVRLVKCPGVGKKTAARLVVELEGKLPEPQEETEPLTDHMEGSDPLSEDAVSALVNLGYPRAKAQKAVKAARQSEAKELEELLKAALREMV